MFQYTADSALTNRTNSIYTICVPYIAVYCCTVQLYSMHTVQTIKQQAEQLEHTFVSRYAKRRQRPSRPYSPIRLHSQASPLSPAFVHNERGGGHLGSLRTQFRSHRFSSSKIQAPFLFKFWVYFSVISAN